MMKFATCGMANRAIILKPLFDHNQRRNKNYAEQDQTVEVCLG